MNTPPAGLSQGAASGSGDVQPGASGDEGVNVERPDGVAQGVGSDETSPSRRRPRKRLAFSRQGSKGAPRPLEGPEAASEQPYLKAIRLDRVRVVGWTLLDGATASSVTSQGAECTGGVDVRRGDISDPDVLALLEAVPAPEAEPLDVTARWDRVIDVIGLGAALAAWVVVVGGARVWARLAEAEIPTVQTLVGLGREWLLVEGLQVLAVPILVGTAVALLCYYTRRPEDAAAAAKAAPDPAERNSAGGRFLQARTLRTLVDNPQQLAWLILALLVITVAATSSEWSELTWGRVRGWTRVVLLLILAAAAVALWLVGRSSLGAREKVAAVFGVVFLAVTLVLGAVLVTPGWFAVMALITVLVLWVTMGALVGKTVGGAAVTLFAGVLAWSGALAILQEAGARDPEPPWAIVTFEDGTTLAGGLLGRTGDRAYLAFPHDRGDDALRRVIVVDNDVIADFRYAEAELEDGDRIEPRREESDQPRTGAGETGAGDDGEGKNGQGGNDGGGGSGGGGGGIGSDAATETTVTGVEKPIRSSDVEFHVVELARRPGFLELDASLRNVSGDDWTVGDTLSEDERGTADGLLVFDPAGRLRYPVAHAAGRCACSSGLDRVRLSDGDWYHLTATFRAPSAAVTSVDLEVPGFGWIQDVPVT